MNIEIMKELLGYKDKIKASQAKRNSFSQEWLSYVSENGFDETAEQYLFSGFEYRKMHPFVDYLKTIENKRDTVLKFLNGKQFSKNKPKSFKMSLSLLAILFSELPDVRILMVYVIRRLPSISLGKDKKRMPETGKAFEKFFFPEFTESIALPELQSMAELKPVAIAEFKALISDATRMLSESGEIDKKIKSAYDRTVNWNKGITAAEIPEATTAENVESVQNAAAEDTDSKPANATKEDPGKVMEKTPVTSWKSSLKFVVATIERLESQEKVLKEQLTVKEHEIEDLKSRISKKNSDLTKAAEELSLIHISEPTRRS